jgi:undecaprenyl pyrophosphate phosphatase UppP
MLASLLATLASGEMVVALRRARRAAIVYLLAGLLILCGVGFLIGAFYIWLATRYGRLEAALFLGVGFIVLAVLVLLVDRLTAKARARRVAERRKADLAALGIAAAAATLPGLLRSRAGLGALLAPALAVVGYAIYRENTRFDPDRDQPSE